MIAYRMPPARLGEAAYQAYAAAVDNVSVSGDPLPAWGDLPTRIRAAWTIAAEQVRHHVHSEP
ncbi:hypothetical protein ACSMX9_22645 [Streptomyces sp. LE64]|uniref:hypothetical protein n=1 Tax=Streptomyces sp. LE64 TaxID=3448653 RepID=UPI0040414881